MKNKFFYVLLLVIPYLILVAEKKYLPTPAQPLKQSGLTPQELQETKEEREINFSDDVVDEETDEKDEE